MKTMKKTNGSEKFVMANGKKFKLFLEEDKIQTIVEGIADRINKDYKSKKPIFLIVLKGSIFFAADLLRKINIECNIETVSAKSYGSLMTSSGMVNLTIANLEIEGKDVIIIEDIVESGSTINTLIERLNLLKPNSLEVASFLSKPDCRKFDIYIKYIGMEIPPEFVIGYGLDYAEKGRILPEIYVYDEE